jgi:haloalkane dehalogenase
VLHIQLKAEERTITHDLTNQEPIAMGTKPSFIEHFVPREHGRIYAREYKGTGPTFVLMHGFPDNLQIYDDLIPYLVAGGRGVVTFDFLGFAASDKPPGATYSFKQQLGDLESIVEALSLDRFVPVAHDSSGPAAINFTLAHPKRVDSLCILNSAYDDAFSRSLAGDS